MRMLEKEKNDVVNGMLNYSKAMVDEIMTEKGNFFPDEFRVLLYLIYAGMLSHYGDEEIQTIYETFSEIDFVYGKNSVYDVVEDIENVSGNEKNMIGRQSTPAFCIAQYSLSRFDDVIKLNFIKYTIYVFENKDISFCDLLDIVTHEINHVVNSMKNVFDDKRCFIRSGLKKDYVKNKTSVGFVLEEALNELQAVDIVNDILAFANYDVDDMEISVILSRLKKEVGDKKWEAAGYIDACEIINPLYSNYELCEIFRNGRLSGQFDVMKENFDIAVGVEGAYDDVFHKSEALCEMYYSGICWNEDRIRMKILDRTVKRYTKQRLNK